MLDAMGRWIRAAGAVASLAALVALVGAASAGAYLRAVTHATHSIPSSSNTTQSHALNCPSGKSLVGAGVHAGGDLTGVALSEAGWTVGTGALFGAAGETDDHAGNWGLNLDATCAERIGVLAPAGTAADYVKNVRVVSAQTRTNSKPKSIGTACPGAREPIAGGGSIVSEGKNRGVALWANSYYGPPPVPVPLPPTWGISAHETDPTARKWKLGVAAICANFETETAARNYVKAEYYVVDAGSESSDRAQRDVAACERGDAIVGGAAVIYDDPGGPLVDPNVALTRSAPADIRHHRAHSGS